ncbi:hypothetical protein HALA3H3_830151 [Halomonas sp. A3H3]|nr:hypothetical protein HALA3H3_830151 [Halomonas sp. A3H3]
MIVVTARYHSPHFMTLALSNCCGTYVSELIKSVWSIFKRATTLVISDSGYEERNSTGNCKRLARLYVVQ